MEATTVTLSHNFVFEYEDTSMDEQTGWEIVGETKTKFKVEMTQDRADDVLSYCKDRMGMGGQGFEFSAGRLRSLRAGFVAVSNAFGLEVPEWD